MYCKMNKKLGWEPWRKQALQLRDLLPWGSLNHAKSLADSQDFKGQLHHQLYIKRAAKQDLHMYCALSMTCCKTYWLTSLLTLTIFTFLFINSCCYCFCFCWLGPTCYSHFVCSCPIDPFTNLKFSSNYKFGLIFMEPPCET